jgi:S1-C subfamily serine protease
MRPIKSFARSSFGSALAGGLIVGLLGWVAIAAGWVKSDDNSDQTATASAPPPAQTVSDSNGSAESINQIYSQDAPGVVFIQATQKQPQPQAFNPFGAPGGSRSVATGSGFVIDDSGRIITNAHVVDGSSDIQVKFGDSGQTYDAKVIGEDQSTDVAVIQVDAPANTLHPLPLGDSSNVQVGDQVVAIGNPFGLDRTATAGIVSAVQREISSPNGFTIENAIQTDAPINPGNSGGPLIDAAGRVIGINSQIESGGSGQGNVGIGFAVPIDTAKQISQQLIANGEVQHAFLGISGTDLTSDVAHVLNLNVDSGAIVQSVVPNSPAAKAGIEAGDATMTVSGQRIKAGGDVIIAADGKPVHSMGDVIAAVDSKQPGDDLQLTLVRDGQQRDVTVQLAERPASAQG